MDLNRVSGLDRDRRQPGRRRRRKGRREEVPRGVADCRNGGTAVRETVAADADDADGHGLRVQESDPECPILAEVHPGSQRPML